jgi:N-acetylneuraminate synthase/sialic acid synthase
LAELEVPCIKIASGDLKTPQLIRHASSKNIPIIMSTGGATMDDIKRAVDCMTHGNFALLHCVASYPNQPHEMNLMAVARMREAFPDTVIGLSDHYNGICMAPPAFIMGARIFEKHFTLNHTWKGTDHALSLEPKGMHDMVRDLRRIRFALGDGIKKRLASEDGPLRKMEKGLYFNSDMYAGQTVKEGDIEMRSPAAMLYPYQAEEILGKALKKGIAAGDPVSLEVLR